MSNKRKLPKEQSPERVYVKCEWNGKENNRDETMELDQNYMDYDLKVELSSEASAEGSGINSEWNDLEIDNSVDDLPPELSSDSDYDETPDLPSQFLSTSELTAFAEEINIDRSLPSFSFEIAKTGLIYERNAPLSIDYLTNLFFSHELLALFVQQTNQHAAKEIAKCAGTTLTRWVDTDVEEMRVFLALLLHMGPCSLPSIDHYWSTNILYSMPLFSSLMTAQRFQLVLRFWWFADESMKARDRLYKVRPLLQHFNAVMRDHYVPNQDLSVEGSIIICHGMLFFRQYLKDIKETKKSNNGIKLYELRESNGVVVKICCDKREALLNGDGRAPGVILHLMEGLLDKGYNVNTDNFYYTYVFNSLALQNYMWTRKTNLSQTMTTNAQKETDKTDIDLMDHMLGYYNGINKSLTWQKKVALHIFEMCISNAHLLFCHAHKSNIKALQFREMLVISLIGDKMPKRHTAETKHIDLHSLESLPPTQKKLRPTRACRVCAALKKRRETRYYCPTCVEKPPLCVDECFKIYHNNKLQL